MFGEAGIGPGGYGFALAGASKQALTYRAREWSRPVLYCSSLIHGRQARTRPPNRQDHHNNAPACPRGCSVSNPQILVWLRAHPLSGRPEIPDIVDVFRADGPELHFLGTGSLVGWMTRERLQAADGAVRFRIGQEEVPASEAADVRLPVVNEIGEGTYEHHPACPDCAGALVWREAGPEFGTHECGSCGSLFNDSSMGVVF